MSAIFISHSSKDNAISAELVARLEEQGHRSLFLDFDPADDIPAGRNWEQELYQNLRACRAVIVLCSEHSMASDWCLTEIAHAKALGKPIFPIKVAPCTLRPILADLPVIDLTTPNKPLSSLHLSRYFKWLRKFSRHLNDQSKNIVSDNKFAAHNPEQAYQRLWQGLMTAGLEPASSFDWDTARPPYPGLIAFQEADAAVFFGRDDSIQEGLDVLNRLRHFSGARLALFLGASGSGKSSLVRAGLLPRLRRDSDSWLVVEPFRPLQRPLDELAVVFSDAFGRYQTSRDWQPIRDELQGAADGRDSDGGALIDMAHDLRVEAERPDATVVLVIDPFEELLGPDPGDQTHRFLSLLCAALQTADGQLMVLGTLRSDFLGNFQEHPVLRRLPFESISVGPMTAAGLAQAIEGPAKTAGLELEPGLVQAMVDDAETDDALPLLAFTLRELWDRYGHRGRLTIEDYRDEVGGLPGSVERAAEAVLAAIPLSKQQEEDLRRAFLSMARINEEGQYVSRVAPWDDLLQRNHEILGQFVQARLLVSAIADQERVLEVAHEALFRTWRRLKVWLDTDREFLLWRQRLRVAVDRWERAGNDEGALLRDALLAEAQHWLDERSDALDDREQRYIRRSLDRREKERVALRRRRRKVLFGLAAGLLIAVILAGFAGLQWQAAEQRRQLAEQQRRAALARQFAAASAADLESRPQRSLLLAVEAVAATRNKDRIIIAEAENSLRRTLAAVGGIPLRGLDGEVLAVAFSADGRWLATGGEDVRVQLWDLSHVERDPWTLPGYEHGVEALTFSPDGRWLATGSKDDTVRLWDLSDVEGEPRVLHGHPGKVNAMAFSADGRRLATGGKAGTVQLWNLSDTETAPQRVLHDDAGYVEAVAFSANGRWLAAGSRDGAARLWDLNDVEAAPRELPGHERGIKSVALNSDGRWLATGGGDNAARLWDLSDMEPKLRVLAGHTGYVEAVAFSADDGWLATGSGDGTVRLWNPKEVETEPRVLRGHEGDVNVVAFSADGRWLATGGSDNTARLWDLSGAEAEPRKLSGHEWGDVAVAFSADGRWLATGSWRGEVRLWDLNDSEAESRLLPGHSEGKIINGVAFSADGRWLATGSEDNTVRLWDLVDAEAGPRLIGHPEEILAVAFSPDGRWLATGSRDGMARLWDVNDAGAEPRVLAGHKKGVKGVAFSADGRWLATGGLDGTARLWDLNDRKAEPRVLVLRAPAEQVFAVAFSADGRWLTTGDDDGAVQLWDVRDAEAEPQVLPGHVNAVYSVAFSSDGRWLASGGEDETARLWDLHDIKAEPRVLRGHKGGVRAVAFSSNGEWLATGSWDQAVLLWRVEPDELLALACRRAGRNLTRDEWRLYLGDQPYRTTCAELPAEVSEELVRR